MPRRISGDQNEIASQLSAHHSAAANYAANNRRTRVTPKYNHPGSFKGDGSIARPSAPSHHQAQRADNMRELLSRAALELQSAGRAPNLVSQIMAALDE